MHHPAALSKVSSRMLQLRLPRDAWILICGPLGEMFSWHLLPAQGEKSLPSAHPPGPANAWGSVVGAADRRDRPPLMYPGDEARSAPRRLSSPVEVGTLSHHLHSFTRFPKHPR